MKNFICPLIFGFYKIKNYQQNKHYTLGLEEAVRAKQLLSKNRFSDLEQLILNLDTDNLTLVIDSLALSSKVTSLDSYLDKVQNKDTANLLLGTHYLHEAWKARSHSYARNVSQKQIELFYHYQYLARQQLEAIFPLNSLVSIEAQARLIRTKMGDSDFEAAQNHYRFVMSQSPDHLWAHLHYCEIIQPKWGGNLDLIHEFILELKQKRPIIQYVAELKLIMDSFILNQNYFGGNLFQLQRLALSRLEVIDKEVSQNPHNSIHRYIIYNYLYLIADTLNQNWISIKSCKKMQGFRTLYPFGVIR